MKSIVVVCLLATSLLGQSVGSKDVQVTGVTGESWLNHLHRTFEETNMGKTGRLGPLTSSGGVETIGWQVPQSAFSTRQTITLHGSDLYRLNCQGCHGEYGLGAPPEINSVINPTRATSIAITMEKMKKLGMDISRADAAEMVKQSKAALLQRLHQGGTDMPPFPQLSEPDIRAILGYLKVLAGVPGAETQQVAVEAARVRVGEHVVKSTCHICHDAAGKNPDPEQLFHGAIPPLNTLTTRTSLPEFERKVRSGAPIMMGTPPSPFRGRMPVFYYLSQDEVADAYLYLKLYPPAIVDPVAAAPEQQRTASAIVPGEWDGGSTTAPPLRASSVKTMVTWPLVAEIFVGLLLAGGMVFTLREIRRLTMASRQRKVLVMGEGRIAMRAARAAALTSPASAVARAATAASSRWYRSDHHTFESSWLARRFEREDGAA